MMENCQPYYIKWQKGLQEGGVLTVLCPAAAGSPAYHTLERKDKNRDGNYFYHAGQKAPQYKALASLSLKLYIVGSLAVVIQST